MSTAPGLYRHYKGGLYRLIGIARHSETLEEMVVYQALYGERGLWARPRAMWEEQITVNGASQPRFARLPEEQQQPDDPQTT